MEKEQKSLKSIKNKKRNASFNLIEVIVIIIMTSLVVGVSSSLIVYKNYNLIENGHKNEKNEKLNEFIEIYNNIISSYVETVDEEELINAAIKGMYNKLGDPFTSYLDKDTTDTLQEKLNGEYQGIGVEITKELTTGYILVNSVFEDSPADKAGLKAGDFITKTNGISVVDKAVEDISKEIKETEEKITLEYLRGGKTYEAEIVPTSVTIPSVIKENFDGIGYLQISTFSNTTYKQFETALKELEKEKIKALIIDLRDNTGGYLISATEIAELFIEKGKIIYQLESKNIITETYKDDTKESRDYKVGVLINGNTASASEILALALKESYGATIIGEKSYGKGTVQETSTLESGEMLKYTTAYWLSPNGIKINNIGILPDLSVELNDFATYSYEVDNQLNKAIEVVK